MLIAVAVEILIAFDTQRKESAHAGPDDMRIEMVCRGADDGYIDKTKSKGCPQDGAHISLIAGMMKHQVHDPFGELAFFFIKYSGSKYIFLPRQSCQHAIGGLCADVIGFTQSK
ncbi:hypothetical protein SDC9_160075 [bioreactor metagenome]|uniref:Uncharacterized protein n=1 Tax=bioreactor metagenome TaxID=1076179 RepID=A0A645FED5_9ZZZZ